MSFINSKKFFFFSSFFFQLCMKVLKPRKEKNPYFSLLMSFLLKESPDSCRSGGCYFYVFFRWVGHGMDGREKGDEGEEEGERPRGCMAGFVFFFLLPLALTRLSVDFVSRRCLGWGPFLDRVVFFFFFSSTLAFFLFVFHINLPS